MRGGVGDLLIGLAAWVIAIAAYWIMRLVGLHPKMQIDEMAGLSIGVMFTGFVCYALLAIVVSVIFGVWLWPFGPN